MRKYLLVLPVICLLFTGVAFAANGDKSQKLTSSVCSFITTRMRNKATTTQTAKNKHLQAYLNMKARVQKVIDKYQAEGYDVSALVTDLDTFDSLLAKFQSDYQVYKLDISALGGNICANSRDEIKTQLNSTREGLQILHTDIESLNSQWKTKLKADLQALKAQVAAKSAVNNTATTGGTN